MPPALNLRTTINTMWDGAPRAVRLSRTYSTMETLELAFKEICELFECWPEPSVTEATTGNMMHNTLHCIGSWHITEI